jgi:hypothetical protein
MRKSVQVNVVSSLEGSVFSVERMYLGAGEQTQA